MLDENGFLIPRGQINRDTLSPIFRAQRAVDFVSREEFAALPAGDECVFDCEVYRNFFYVAFKHIETGKFYAFELSPDHDLDIDFLSYVMWRFCCVGFNSNGFDNIIGAYALTGATCRQIKEICDAIIVGGMRRWDLELAYSFKVPEWNTIDLIEVAPLEGPLKLYAARVHSKRLQDLPFDPAKELTADDAAIIRPYCCNDLDATENLFRELVQQLALRANMSNEYGVDLRSKSDAQVAESVINVELARVTGKYPKKPHFELMTFKYDVPEFVDFTLPTLTELLKDIAGATFAVNGRGEPQLPDELLDRVVKIAGVPYKLGIGGLHSMESCVSHYAADGYLADNDVESFYPAIILTQRLYPTHLGEAFLTVYEGIVKRRLAAKKAGDKITSDSLKITINGSFGKLGNLYSTLYAPKLLLQVTLTGQLALLMLIEYYAQYGIEVVSANTDGVVTKYCKDQRDAALRAIEVWRNDTGFKTEETLYKSTHSRDVNNYLAVKIDGEIKSKGVYSEKGSALNSVLSKNPETLICADAIKAFISHGTPIEKTIAECRDIRRFTSIARVRGSGAYKGNEYLGKVVRWYYAKGEQGHIARVGSGNKVPLTDGAKPAMDLPDSFPTDVDFAWYVTETRKMMYGCELLRAPQSLTLY